jgi:hypothetical protein
LSEMRLDVLLEALKKRVADTLSFEVMLSGLGIIYGMRILKT